MNIQQLEDCAAVLGEMSKNFIDIPSESTKTLEAGLSCQMAQLYVLELAAHLTKGMEPFDAYVATANGELEIPESKALMLSILAAKPNK